MINDQIAHGKDYCWQRLLNEYSMEDNHFDDCCVFNFRHIHKTKNMYYIGIGVDRLQHKFNPFSQWKHYHCIPRMSPFVQVNIRNKSSKIKEISNIIKKSSNNISHFFYVVRCADVTDNVNKSMLSDSVSLNIIGNIISKGDFLLDSTIIGLIKNVKEVELSRYIEMLSLLIDDNNNDNNNNATIDICNSSRDEIKVTNEEKLNHFLYYLYKTFLSLRI